MQKIRLWEITPDQELAEMTTNQISLEERLEDWLVSDISVLDPDLLVIGRQITTDFNGVIDLLCLDSRGDSVVVELKQGRTPREVTAQALDYASWVKNLSAERITEIADRYLGSEGSLTSRYQERFGEELPSELNLNHRSLVVAEEIDASTERIVRYLSDMGVPINVATVQHFVDEGGREILAQVYLIEPEVAEAKSQSASKRTYATLKQLEAEADDNDIGEMFRALREGIQGILLARPYHNRIWYGVRLSGGRQRLLLVVRSRPREDSPGMSFTAHASRFNEYMRVSKEQLREWLPQSTQEASVTGWAGSSPEERESAEGLGGSFQSVEEVERFIAGLRSIQADSAPLQDT